MWLEDCENVLFRDVLITSFSDTDLGAALTGLGEWRFKATWRRFFCPMTQRAKTSKKFEIPRQ
jgi:hypothetical protein